MFLLDKASKAQLRGIRLVSGNDATEMDRYGGKCWLECLWKAPCFTGNPADSLNAVLAQGHGMKVVCFIPVSLAVEVNVAQWTLCGVYYKDNPVTGISQ
ncbi:hypothetical protein [Paenarthrobacter nicotinovorans]|uniref:hypothetical protein n=1 Tax=Paenarthrobacter nicotinovorans TaxID=29320 RepID=UPI003DA34AB5